MKRAVDKILSLRPRAEVIALPAVLIAGFAILRLSDGAWWAVMLWVITAPLVYLLVDFLLIGKIERAAGADARRPRRVMHAKSEPTAEKRATPPDWSDAADVSTGAEILRRGRRYDQRRRA